MAPPRADLGRPHPLALPRNRELDSPQALDVRESQPPLDLTCVAVRVFVAPRGLLASVELVFESEECPGALP